MTMQAISESHILSREEAIASGEKFYFTGKPCPHGHIATRRVSNHVCTGCTEQARASTKKWEARQRECGLCFQCSSPAVQGGRCQKHLLAKRKQCREAWRVKNQGGAHDPQNPDRGYLDRIQGGIQHKQKRIGQKEWIEQDYQYNSLFPHLLQLDSMSEHYRDSILIDENDPLSRLLAMENAGRSIFSKSR